MEYANFTNSNIMMEPFPAKAASWMKTSKYALIIAGIAALISVVLLGITGVKLAAAENRIKAPPFNTRDLIIGYAKFTAKVKEAHIIEHVQANSLFSLLQPAMSGCTRWGFKRDDTKLTLDYTLTADSQKDDTQTSLARKMTDLGFVVTSPDKEVEPLRHVIIYGRQ